MKAAFVYDAVRTPFGSSGAGLPAYAPTTWPRRPTAVVDRSPDLDAALVDEVVLGNANGAGEDNRNVGADGGTAGRPAGAVPATP